MIVETAGVHGRLWCSGAELVGWGRAITTQAAKEVEGSQDVGTVTSVDQAVMEDCGTRCKPSATKPWVGGV